MEEEVERRTTRRECLAYLGSRFRILLYMSSRYSDVEVGEELLKRYILVHLKSNDAKFALLLEMISKLYKLANKEIPPDNADSLMNHVSFLFFWVMRRSSCSAAT